MPAIAGGGALVVLRDQIGEGDGHVRPRAIVLVRGSIVLAGRVLFAFARISELAIKMYCDN